MTLPAPYYEDGSVTIYHGDCREVMRFLDFDVIVADPPYGISVVRGGSVGGSNEKPATAYAAVAGDQGPFDPRFLLTCRVPTILWGGNHFGSRLPDASRWLVWDKREGGNSDNFADAELAWTNLGGPVRLHSQRWRGRYSRNTQGDLPRVHPTQKPVSLMAWCIGFTEGIILDPFMGSGTTLRAAKDLGRKAIGIELEERYCEIAAERCSQEVLDMGAAA